MKLTVSKYYTPNGNDIHEKGIVPDIEIEFDTEGYYVDKTDNQLENAIQYFSGEMWKKLNSYNKSVKKILTYATN